MLMAQPVSVPVPFSAEPVTLQASPPTPIPGSMPTLEPQETEAQMINMATNATQPDVSPSP